jgi:3-isopropylmalate/(R)-2-methylmalate dehydratase large subunit
MIAPDEVTFNYIKGREFSPKGAEWDKKMEYWKTLYSDPDAVFDMELTYEAADIEPMITYGTNPGMGVAVTGHIPDVTEVPEDNRPTFEKALQYMNFSYGSPLKGNPLTTSLSEAAQTAGLKI